ncbi:probable transcriptional regulator, lysR family, possible activator of the expression of chvE protein [Oceanicola granulosus HTCC2516]|uniref:Probable transcriptional regulator, lysR family, possible activator of the expression of chvE protein n=1 Tax=Oceanicola granulosus (strain ATCC BAA-861 / DSM 15982 / KCTC 12143 / HTCC2516) TaxID=314256 RepID=Q2CI15_OCEGH|nr:LysR family transcriptional regulator [Oceanicola granulosus]EAR52443.1 probable transcriptional regulator, lysR family, possible activator of the expression of chvE protein [Oceanicola granulosus HTCC2516]
MSHDLAKLQLRHYRLIDAIASQGQLSVAAEVLAVSQPAASRMLAEVERTLGAPLFERHPKGMRPTPLGEVLARRARWLVSELDEAAAELAAFRAGRFGTVRIGAVTGAAVAIVAPAIRALGVERADTDIHVEVGPSGELMAALEAGELDFAVCRLAQGFDARTFELLDSHVEEVRLVVREGHPLPRHRVPLAALAGAGWVIQSSGTPMRAAMEAAYVAAGLAPPTEIVNTSSTLVTMALLAQSDLVAPVAREVAELIAGPGMPLRRLALDREIVISPYHLIRHRARPLTPLAARLMALVTERMTG